MGNGLFSGSRASWLRLSRMTPMPDLSLTPRTTLPHDAGAALLLGRVWRPDRGGPAIVTLRGEVALNLRATTAVVMASFPSGAAGAIGTGAAPPPAFCNASRQVGSHPP